MEVLGLRLGKVGIGVSVAALLGSSAAYAVNLSIDAQGCTGYHTTGNTIVLTGCTGGGNDPGPSPTPGGGGNPTPTPTQPPAQPGNCPQGTLSQPLSDGGFGKDDVFISNGETHTYCLPLPRAVRSIVVNEYDQCLGTNVQLVLTPPVGATYSTSTLIPTTTARSTMRLGSSRSPTGFIPQMNFILEVRGGEVGPNCFGGRSKYDLRWYYVD